MNLKGLGSNRLKIMWHGFRPHNSSFEKKYANMQLKYPVEKKLANICEEINIEGI